MRILVLIHKGCVVRMKKWSLIEWYNTHKTENSISYNARTKRIRDGMDKEKALMWSYTIRKKEAEKKYNIIHRPKNEDDNIVVNQEEYVVIFKAYKRQLNSLGDSREDDIMRDKLEKELKKFIWMYPQFARGV